MRITVDVKPGPRSAEMEAALALQMVGARVFRGEREGAIAEGDVEATFKVETDEAG